MFPEKFLHNLPGKTSFVFLSKQCTVFEVLIIISIELNEAFIEKINN